MTDDRRLVGPKGELFRFLRTAADTGGAVMELEAVLPAHTKGPPLHFHLAERESFHIADGELAIRAGRYWRLYGAGDDAVVEPGTPHTFANRSGAPARIIIRVEPPDPFETMVRLWLVSKLPPILKLASVHHGDDATLMLAHVPVFPQRMVWNGLAGVARLLRR